MNRRIVLLSIVAISAAGFGGAAWYVNRPELITEPEPLNSEKTGKLVRPYSPVLGPPEAPVTIVEFFDPACEACRAFHPIIKQIMQEHGDAVRVVIRYTPFHGEASRKAIRILEAARMQNIFEPVLEAILREQPKWASHGAPNVGLLFEIAAVAGLDTDAARIQMLAPSVTAIINQDTADVEFAEVRGTPTFFVNGKPLKPFGRAELQQMVASEVAAIKD